MAAWSLESLDPQPRRASCALHRSAVEFPVYGDSFTVSKSIAREEYIDPVLSGLGPRVGDTPFVLAGFSFGGVVAAMTAVRLSSG